MRCLSACDFTTVKDDSDYLSFKETTWSYSKFVYRSTFLCEPVLQRSQPIQICCTMITICQYPLINYPTLLSWGAFKYYVIKEVGGWGQKMAIFDDLQYCTRI